MPTRIQIADALAAILPEGKVWTSDPDIDGKYRVRVYSGPRGAWISAAKDGKIVGGTLQDIMSHLLAAGAVESVHSKTLSPEWMASIAG